jgi:hypothetical protein
VPASLARRDEVAELLLEFSRGGRVQAELLTEDAPRTSAAVLEALPLEAEIKHANFFGPVLQARVAAFAAQVENPFVLGVRAGEILVRPAADESQELMIAFGHALFLEDKEWVQHTMFARVRPDDLETLLEIGRRIRTRGKERLSISRTDAASS